MKIGRFIAPSILLTAWIVLASQTGRADTITYSVNLDTSPLIGNLAGPFSLNFQFIDGSGVGDGNNTVSLSAFQFGAGGGAAGAPTLEGGASGSLASGVTLTDSDFFNAFTQRFTPGTLLSFNLSLTTNMDAGGAPDQFSFAILDCGGTELPSAGPAREVLSIDIASTPIVRTYSTSSVSSAQCGGVSIVLAAPQVQGQPTPSSSVPEPATFLPLATGLLGAALGYRRRLKTRRRETR